MYVKESLPRIPWLSRVIRNKPLLLTASFTALAYASKVFNFGVTVVDWASRFEYMRENQALLLDALRWIVSPPGSSVMVGLGLIAFFLAVILAVNPKAKEIAAEANSQAGERTVSEGNDLQDTAPAVSVSCPYQWSHDVVENQASRIRDFVDVVKLGVFDPRFDDDIPTIRCGLLIRNRSIIPVSFIGEEIGQDMYFEKTRLAERKFLKEYFHNLTQGDVQIMFEQRLSHLEVKHIRNSPEGKFYFNYLTINIGSTIPVPTVNTQQLIIPNLGVRLNQIVTTDDDAQKLTKERDDLRQRVDQLQREHDSRLPDGDVMVTDARYGAHDEWLDVKAILQSLRVEDGRIIVSGHYNDIFGRDPKRGVPKLLTVQYRYNDKDFSLTVPENSKLTLPI